MGTERTQLPVERLSVEAADEFTAAWDEFCFNLASPELFPDIQPVDPAVEVVRGHVEDEGTLADLSISRSPYWSPVRLESVSIVSDSRYAIAMELPSDERRNIAIVGFSVIGDPHPISEHIKFWPSDELDDIGHPEDTWKERGMDLSGMQPGDIVISQLQGNNFGARVLEGVSWHALGIELIAQFAAEQGHERVFLLPSRFHYKYPSKASLKSTREEIQDIKDYLDNEDLTEVERRGK